jgi:hypothetical protein
MPPWVVTVVIVIVVASRIGWIRDMRRKFRR